MESITLRRLRCQCTFHLHVVDFLLRQFIPDTHRHIFNFDGAPSSSGCGRVFKTPCRFQALCSVSLSTLFTWTVWFWAPSTTRIICPALFTTDLAPLTKSTFDLRTVSTDQCWLRFPILRCAGRARHPTLGELICCADWLLIDIQLLVA